jgi:hypothetical protein
MKEIDKWKGRIFSFLNGLMVIDGEKILHINTYSKEELHVKNPGDLGLLEMIVKTEKSGNYKILVYTFDEKEDGSCRMDYFNYWSPPELVQHLLPKTI